MQQQREHARPIKTGGESISAEWKSTINEGTAYNFNYYNTAYLLLYKKQEPQPLSKSAALLQQRTTVLSTT